MTALGADGRWEHHGDTVIYDSEWVRLVTADVVLPDGRRIDHHVLRMPRPAAGCLMVDGGRVLLLYRHRFITNSWGWEIPAGGIDPGETAAEAARREALEESGWEPLDPEPLCTFHPANGVVDQAFHIFLARRNVGRGEPTDPNEAARVEWIDVHDVRRLLLTGEITDGMTFGAISYAFASGEL